MKYTNGQASMEKQATVKQVKQVKQRILEITIDNFLWHSSHFLAQTTPIHHHLKIKDVDVKPSIPIPKHLQRWKLLRRRKSIVKNIDIDAHIARQNWLIYNYFAILIILGYKTMHHWILFLKLCTFDP